MLPRTEGRKFWRFSFGPILHNILNPILKNHDVVEERISSLVTQTIKNLPAMREAWVQSLDWEDPLEKGLVTHSGILAWRIWWTEEPGRLLSMGLQRAGCD